MDAELWKEMLGDYIGDVYAHMVDVIELNPDCADQLIEVHASVIEDSFNQNFPAHFCCERIRMADLKSMNSGGPIIGFEHFNPSSMN